MRGLGGGDSPSARERVIELAAAAGLKAWHAGPLANSVATEAMTSVLLHINKHYRRKDTGIRLAIAPSSAPDRSPRELEFHGVHLDSSIEEADDVGHLISDALARQYCHAPTEMCSS